MVKIGPYVPNMRTKQRLREVTRSQRRVEFDPEQTAPHFKDKFPQAP